MLEFNVDKQAGIQLYTCERKSRWCQRFLWLSWLAMLAFVGWLFWKGIIFGHVQPQVVQEQLAACKKSNDVKPQDTSCKAQLEALKNQLNHGFSKKYSQQIKASGEQLKNAEKALSQSREKIKALEARQRQSSKTVASDAEVRQKLFFYEQILGSNGVEDAVFINHFAAKAATEKGHYRFQLILARLGKHKNTTGKYDIFLKGNKIVEIKEQEKLADGKIREKTRRKKEPVTYKHTDLLPAEAVSGKNTFAFKYYQINEGEFVLPDKFELQSLSVNVMPEGLSSIKNNYDWNSLKQQKFREFTTRE